MREVPFYANHEDNMHCMLAVYRSIVDYFLHRKLSWQELESFTGFESGKAAWSLLAITRFAAMGFDIRMIEPFDYKQYGDRGEAYLREIWDDDKLRWQIEHTNLLAIATQIPDFLAKVSYENRAATLGDIDSMLAEGRLVNVMLNACALNDIEGYDDHSLLITDLIGGEYIVHDPGGRAGPPMASRKVGKQKLWQAMGGDNHTSEVTGFKLKDRRNLRLDQYVVSQFPALSRAYAVSLIDDGKVLVNGEHSKAGYKLRQHDSVTIDYDPEQSTAIPAIDLPVIYEDDDCIVLNKPAGVLTHSVGKLHGEATVATFLRDRLHGDLARPISKEQGIRNAKVNQDNLRAGIVHRLDRATSGVMICAKTPQALAWLQKQFHDRTVEKTYSAVIKGSLNPSTAVIDMPIARNPKAPATFRVDANGKSAVTTYDTLASNDRYSLLELKPATGRTHQLRVHLAYQHHPIIGDYMYDGEKAERLYLHAHQLTITLPHGKRQTFCADLPPEFMAKVTT